MSIHPEIAVGKQAVLGTPHYFVTKSGKVVTVHAGSKEGARDIYIRTIAAGTQFIPFIECLCCMCFSVSEVKSECSGTVCGRLSRCYEYSVYRTDQYLEMVNFLLKKYPDQDILRRICMLLNEKPTIEHLDYQIVTENPDGTTTKQSPLNIRYTFKEAAISATLLYGYSQYSIPSVLEKLFGGFSLKNTGIVGGYTFVTSNCCWERFLNGIHNLKLEHIDMLGGSLDPLTEKPAIPESHLLELDRPNPLRHRNTYEPIKL